MKQRKYDMKAVMTIARGIARELICDEMEDKGVNPDETMVERCVERLLVMNQNIVLMAKREYLGQLEDTKMSSGGTSAKPR